MAKIYNEVVIDMNPESPDFEKVIHEDSYEYNGDMMLMGNGKFTAPYFLKTVNGVNYYWQYQFKGNNVNGLTLWTQNPDGTYNHVHTDMTLDNTALSDATNRAIYAANKHANTGEVYGSSVEDFDPIKAAEQGKTFVEGSEYYGYVYSPLSDTLVEDPGGKERDYTGDVPWDIMLEGQKGYEFGKDDPEKTISELISEGAYGQKTFDVTGVGDMTEDALLTEIIKANYGSQYGDLDATGEHNMPPGVTKDEVLNVMRDFLPEDINVSDYIDPYDVGKLQSTRRADTYELTSGASNLYDRTGAGETLRKIRRGKESIAEGYKTGYEGLEGQAKGDLADEFKPLFDALPDADS
jgi:hypothetical protein